MIHNRGIRLAKTYFETYSQAYGVKEGQEMLGAAVESVDAVLDYLEKDLTFNADRFLGVIITPEHLWQLLMLVGTVAFAYF
jgi:hypothetical protein